MGLPQFLGHINIGCEESVKSKHSHNVMRLTSPQAGFMCVSPMQVIRLQHLRVGVGYCWFSVYNKPRQGLGCNM